MGTSSVYQTFELFKGFSLWEHLVVLRRTESFVWVKLSMFTPLWPLPRQLRWSPWVLPWWSPLFVALSISASRLSFLPLLTLTLAASCVLCVVPLAHCRWFRLSTAASIGSSGATVLYLSFSYAKYFHQLVVRDLFCPAAFDLFCFLIVLTPNCQY